MAERLPPHLLARYERQILLPGVGVEGQKRIMAATGCVGGEGFSNEIACRYLERAGVAAIVRGAIDVDEPLLDVEAAKATFAGSRAALDVIRAAVREDDCA